MFASFATASLRLREIVPGFYVNNLKKMASFFWVENGNGFDSDIMCMPVLKLCDYTYLKTL